MNPQVYAVVVGAISAFVAAVYLVPCTMHIPFAFIADFLLCFLWIVLFGIFGNVRASLPSPATSRLWDFRTWDVPN
jgi:hypothetical protein